MTEITTEGSSFQNNTANIGNTRGGYFSYFSTIGANPFGRGFGAFRNNNNNNPPSLPPLLPLLEFRKGLGGRFNLPSEGNVGGLDSNITALVNALAGANLGINHVERKSNHVKLTEFGGTEAENPNKWLE